MKRPITIPGTAATCLAQLHFEFPSVVSMEPNGLS
jgi:hypothetical protein